MYIGFASEKDKTELMGLWCQCFEGDDEYCSYFFEQGGFQPDQTVIIKNDNIESAAYIFSGEIVSYGLKVIYLYAVATGEKYRGQGNAGKLLEFVYRYAADNNINAVILNAEDGKGALYEKHGMKPMLYIYQKVLFRSADKSNILFDKCGCEEFISLRNRFLDRINGSVKWDKRTAEYMYKDIITTGDILKAMINGEKYFAAVSYYEDKIIIRETDIPDEYISALTEYVVKSQVKHTTIRQKVYKKSSPQNVQVNE